MRKLLFVIPLAALLLAVTIPLVGADMDPDDPVLCVEGKWLIVDKAVVSAVKVTVPEGARYGNQRQGGCKTPGPNAPLIRLIQEVKQRGERHIMHVWVDGKYASKPTVTVYYGDVVQVKHNNGRSTLNFWFFLR